ncbi:MAG: DUF2442 domain-containing protein [Candidatus Omnitrophota bacterium]
MGKLHNIKNPAIDGSYLKIEIDGESIKTDLKKLSKRLRNAKKSELKKFEISPSGYGIHWPLIDEDISIDALLGIKHEVSAFNK